MDLVLKQKITVFQDEADYTGTLKLSGLLRYAQQVSGAHSDGLGWDWDRLAQQGLFWAVLRHRAVIQRMPKVGEEMWLETWPMPTTRSAYPRAVRAMDEFGNVLFETVSLWVLMNMQSRAMVLPGKSGVDVPGILRGDEPASPGSAAPGKYENSVLWQITQDDLDINGHVNNAKYLDPVEKLLSKAPREFTVCYLAEALLGQEISLNWGYSPEGILSVDGLRERTDVSGEKERIFAVRAVV